MTRGTRRTLLSLALLVALPLATAVHLGHQERAAAGVSENDHGPWTPCPAADESPCLACASAALFAPLATVAAPPPPGPGAAAAEADAARVATPATALPAGRSPPR